MASTYPIAIDTSFPGYPYTDNTEYVLAAYANSWILAIQAIENAIGAGSGSSPSNPLYSVVFNKSYTTVTARIAAAEAFAKAIPVIDSAVGDIQPVAAVALAGAVGKTSDAGHVHRGVTTWKGQAGPQVPQTGDYTAAMVTNAADKSSASPQVFTGLLQAPALISSGLAGATIPSRFVGGTLNGPPTSGSFNLNDFVIDRSGTVWIFTASGWLGKPAQTPRCRLVAYAQMNPGPGLNPGQIVGLHADMTETVGISAPTDNQMTIVTPGPYLFVASVQYLGPPANAGFSTVYLYVDGTERRQKLENFNQGALGGVASATCTDYITLAAGDVVTMWSMQNSGGNLAIQAGIDPPATWLSAIFVGP